MEFASSQRQFVKFRFCIGQCNPESALQFLGIWRPILRSLLSHVASMYEKKPYKILMQVIESVPREQGKNKLQFLTDFFNLGSLDADFVARVQQYNPQLPHQKRTQFFEPVRYDIQFETQVLQFFLGFVKKCMEMAISWQNNTLDKGFEVNTLIIFILDNASLMNEVDWRLFSMLINETDPVYHNLIIVSNL